MAKPIKLKSLMTYDTTRVQSSHEFTKSSFYIWEDSGAFELCVEYKTDENSSGRE